MPVLNAGMLKELEIILPPIKLQHEFSQLETRVKKHMLSQKHAVLKTQEMFDSLTKNAFRGELNQSTTPLKEAISA